MDRRQKLATTSTASKQTNVTPSHGPTAQNPLLVWLDANIDIANNNDYRNMITKLREVINTVHPFTEVDICINFITEIEKGPAVMIFSGTLGEQTVPIVHDMPQISTIYIFCANKARHEQWTKRWPKVKGVFTEFSSIYEALKQTPLETDQNTIPISFVAANSGTSNENLNELDQSFIYIQILKDIILTINFDQEHIKDFITYCRKQLAGNTNELKYVEKLEKEYHRQSPISWYTCQCFLSSMLTQALCTMNLGILIKMGFFIRDLHEHITKLHSEQYAGHHSKSFVVYRSEALPEIVFDRLKKTQGGLISFNNFLLTSINKHVPLELARRTIETSGMVGVLFIMTIDSSILSTPFANIRDVSHVPGEEEILFSIQSVFRIGQIKQMDGSDRLWQVELSLPNDNDLQLHALTEHVREEAFPHKKGWNRLSELLIKLGHFNKAQQVYEAMLNQRTDEREKVIIYHMLGVVKEGQKKYAEAIALYKNSIERKQRILPPAHPDLATSYSSIGQVYEKMGEYPKALSSYEKAFEIYEKTLPPNHPDLIDSYTRRGSLYEKLHDYSKAASFYERAVDIGQRTLPANHSRLQSLQRNLADIKKKL
jgi:hypothetical protein